ncbi:hypothetical protein ERUR111494_03225 [Erysipelothrix urinaevulpis]|uniref:hypothetical protein n=1 Tax=Erysipelothrix urinaevulpis TaxID=2683717 RepID=UPI00135AA6A4|nr:hypothetical protein [Erysipelothrix urinaevulpis]
MSKLIILFRILIKEFLGKFNVKENKQNLYLFVFVVVIFVYYSLSITPTNLNSNFEMLNNIVILGILQIPSVAIISYLFVYISFDFSYKLNQFFVTNFISNKLLNTTKKILMSIGVQIFALILILLQAGIPLYRSLNAILFLKFILMSVIGFNLMFVIIDCFTKYLETNYQKLGFKLTATRIIILVNLSIIYVAVYYSELVVWFNDLKKLDVFSYFSKSSLIFWLFLLFVSFILLWLYSLFITHTVSLTHTFTNRYFRLTSSKKMTTERKYIYSIIRNSKSLFILVFTFLAQMLNLMMTKDPSIALSLSLFMTAIGINFFSNISHEQKFLFFYNNHDSISILGVLFLVFTVINSPFIVLALRTNPLAIFQAYLIFLSSIYLGVVFPRENNSLNRFISNFMLTIFSFLLILLSIIVKETYLKYTLHVLLTFVFLVFTSYKFRRFYEKNSI